MHHWRHVTLVSLGVRDAVSRSDVSGFYQMTWPIFLEVVFFGFILTALLERYSPVQFGRTLAERLTDHTVVIGYDHLGMRIVDHLRDTEKPFAVVERAEAPVAELLDAEEPVVVVPHVAGRPGGRRATRDRLRVLTRPERK